MAELEASPSSSSNSVSAVTAALRGASLSSGSATEAGKDVDLMAQAPATGAAPSPSLEAQEQQQQQDGEEGAPVTNGETAATTAAAAATALAGSDTTEEAVADPDKPNLRYIAGCPGDLEEAKRRWRLTLQWRKDNQIDTMLERPHQYFQLIKEAYPHFFCLEGYEGDPVYIERSGQVDQPRLKAAGCGVEELVRHYVYCTEFCYQKLYPEDGATWKRTITVFDVKGVGIRDLVGDALSFLKKSAHVIQEHYVERSKVIMIVNCPLWFSGLWKIIRPLVNERTQKKIKIVKSGSETLKAMQEFIPIERIPVEYGGQLKYSHEADSCRWNSPQEMALKEHVMAVNARHGVESKWN